MKKLCCLVCCLVLILLPLMGNCEDAMNFLKNDALTTIMNSPYSAEDLCEAGASMVVALQLALMMQEEVVDGHFNTKTCYIGYADNCFYAVSEFSPTERAVYMMDMEYKICKYRIDVDVDLTQNEEVIKELCPDHYEQIDPKELESALYNILK